LYLTNSTNCNVTFYTLVDFDEETQVYSPYEGDTFTVDVDGNLVVSTMTDGIFYVYLGGHSSNGTLPAYIKVELTIEFIVDDGLLSAINTPPSFTSSPTPASFLVQEET